VGQLAIIDVGEAWPFPAVTEARHEGRPDWVRISEARADEFLGVLPPIYFHGGFFVSEPASHEYRKVHGSQTQFYAVPVYAAVCKVGGAYYMREVAQDAIQEARAELLRALGPSSEASNGP